MGTRPLWGCNLVDEGCEVNGKRESRTLPACFVLRRWGSHLLKWKGIEEEHLKRKVCIYPSRVLPRIYIFICVYTVELYAT